MQRLTLGHRDYRFFNTPPHDAPRTETDKKESGAKCEDHGKAKPDEAQKNGVLPFSLSPDKPLFSLGRRKIYPDDLLLFLLICALMQDKADPSLLAAAVYLLASD